MKASKKLKLTPRGRYAVLAMADLAQQEGNRPIPLIEIAQGGGISLSYLEQLFAGLRRNGLVKSYRGPGGGYVLAKGADSISVADILVAAEDCVPARKARKNHVETRTDTLHTAALWACVGDILHAALRHVSLDDVVHGRLEEVDALNKLFETLA